MNLPNTLRLPEAMVKAFSHADAQHRSEGAHGVSVPPLTITISRQAGARETPLPGLLAADLDGQFWTMSCSSG